MDEGGQKIGTFVVDLDSLFQMYRDQMYRQLQQQTGSSASALPVDNGALGSVQVSDYLEWVKDENGSVHLRPIDKPPPGGDIV